MLEKAETSKQPELVFAMKIALTTALRRSDIHQLKFEDIHDDHLHVSLNKSKGKTKLAFPLSLKNPLLDESLGQIIQGCQNTRVRSKYLIHQIRPGRRTQQGNQVNLDYLTASFSRLRDKVNFNWEGPPPTFHEIRSLAERTYRDVGIDTPHITRP
ncbi:tyrosine-type recombinase/integrase [Enterovibrio sp. Hal110]